MVTEHKTEEDERKAEAGVRNTSGRNQGQLACNLSCRAG